MRVHVVHPSELRSSEIYLWHEMQRDTRRSLIRSCHLNIQ